MISPRTDPMTTIESLTGEPVVGRVYDVPCVRATWMPCNVPVFGAKHDDKDIGFPDEHFHVDWRFAHISYMESRGGGNRFFGHVLSHFNAGNMTVVRRPRKCLRPMPTDYPTTTPWLKELEAAHTHHRLGSCRVCPHRGLPLSGVPVVDGVIVCPGHGLAWSAATGELVHRKQ